MSSGRIEVPATRAGGGDHVSSSLLVIAHFHLFDAGPRYYQNQSEVKVPDAGEDVFGEMRKELAELAE